MTSASRFEGVDRSALTRLSTEDLIALLVAQEAWHGSELAAQEERHKAELAALQQRIAALEHRLGLNSGNTR